jgi:hypothetical protein
MKYNPLSVIALAALTVGLCGCGSTSLKQTWKSPTYTGGPVQKIAVLVVDERELYRQSIENHFAGLFNQKGQSALATQDLLSLPAIKADKQAAAARLREAGADSVLIVRLVDRATHANEVRATPARFTPTISGFESGDWYDYYSIAFMDMGTTWGNMKMEIYLDSGLYDLKSGQRLWSALTRTALKENMDRVAAITPLAATVFAAMRKDGMVR